MNFEQLSADIMTNVFALDLEQYLDRSERVLYGIRLIEDDKGNICDCAHLFGPDSPEVTHAIKRKGLISCKAGYLVNAGLSCGLPDLKGDFLILSDTLLRASKRVQCGQLFHELCHLVVDAKLHHKFELNSSAYTEGKKLRAYTQYSGPYSDDRWHTDEWFALIYVASGMLALNYRSLYRSHRNAARYALKFDLLGRWPRSKIQWL